MLLYTHDVNTGAIGILRRHRERETAGPLVEIKGANCLEHFRLVVYVVGMPPVKYGGTKGVQVRKAAILAFICTLSIVCSNASAQVFYQYPEAPVVPSSQIATGPYVSIGENKLFRAGGFIRMNATKHMDVGFELLADSYDGTGRGALGTDLRLSIFQSYKAIPFDLSVGVGLGFMTGGDVRSVEAPISSVISSPFKSDSGNTLVPYLGVYLVIVNTKVDLPGGRDMSDTELDVELRGGVRYTLASGTDLFLSLFVGREAQAMFGVGFWPLGRN
jgi:hypothetical protein